MARQYATSKPLSVDRAFDDKPFAEQRSVLFRLPSEILDRIVHYIYTDSDPATLASLALASSDCRQLSRVCRSHSLDLRMNERSAGLLRLLLEEAAEREAHGHGRTRAPSLGTCIRQLIVSGGLGRGRAPERESDDEWAHARRCLTSTNPEVYFSTLNLILPNLQHLEKLTLGHISFRVGPAMCRLLETVARSSVQHLVINTAVEWDLADVILDPKHELPLTRLDFHCWDVAAGCTTTDSRRATSFLESIIRSCSSTLAFLSLRLPPSDRDWTNCVDSLDTPLSMPHLSLPKLRHLRIHAQTMIDEATLDNWFSSPQLRTLNVDITDIQTRNALCAQRRLPNLECLMLTDFKHDGRYAQPIEFVKSNPQLRIFEMKGGQPDSNIYPLLKALVHSTTSTLTSLALTWKHTQIPKDSLRLVTSLVNLENLYLSAGWPYSRVMNWALDHEDLSTKLAPLTRLKRLVLSRDTYPVTLSVNVSDYYIDTMSVTDIKNILVAEGTSSDEIVAKTPRIAWEERHLRHMIDWTTTYASKLPTLKWIYIGQRSLRIRRSMEEVVQEDDKAKTIEMIMAKAITRTRYPVMNTQLVSDSIFEQAFGHKLY